MCLMGRVDVGINQLYPGFNLSYITCYKRGRGYISKQINPPLFKILFSGMTACSPGEAGSDATGL